MKVYTYNPFNPYDYNFISLKKQREDKVVLNATQEQIIEDPTYNLIGKFLGVQTKAEWSKYYQKVQEIAEYGKEKAGVNDPSKIRDVLTELVNKSPQLNDKRIDDIYINVRLNKLNTANKEGDKK
jgi:hypothetical protein